MVVRGLLLLVSFTFAVVSSKPIQTGDQHLRRQPLHFGYDVKDDVEANYREQSGDGLAVVKIRAEVGKDGSQRGVRFVADHQQGNSAEARTDVAGRGFRNQDPADSDVPHYDGYGRGNHNLPHLNHGKGHLDVRHRISRRSPGRGGGFAGARGGFGGARGSFGSRGSIASIGSKGSAGSGGSNAAGAAFLPAFVGGRKSKGGSGHGNAVTSDNTLLHFSLLCGIIMNYFLVKKCNQ